MSRVSPLRLCAVAGLAAGAAAAGLATAPSALAAGLPTPTVADATIEVGEHIVISGSGCLPPSGAPYPVADVHYAGRYSSWFESAERGGWTMANPDGTWTLTLTTHVDVTPGTYQMVVGCDRYTADQTYPPVTVTISAAGSTAPLPSSAPSSAPSSVPAAPPVGTIRGTSANTPGVSSPDTGVATGDRAVPGQRVVKVLRGFRPFEKVTVTLHSDPWTAGVFTADAQGVVTATFSLPAGTPSGTHTFTYDGDAGTYFQESFTVTAAAAGTSPELAYTGASIGLPLGLGAGVLAVGGGLVLLARRRSPEAPQS